MNNQQNIDPQYNPQSSQTSSNKLFIIIAGIVMVGVVLMGSCIGFVAYLNVQEEARIAKEKARIAKEKAAEEKRELERQKEEAEKKAAEEKRKKEEAEEKARKEREEREAKEKAEREEKERIANEKAIAEKKRKEEEAMRPKVEISKVRMSTDTRIVKGEFDYGIVVNGLVRNAADSSADFTVLAYLTCSGGNWVRTQILNFSAGETKNLTYFFHEPNFGDDLSNCQSRIIAKPVR